MRRFPWHIPAFGILAILAHKGSCGEEPAPAPSNAIDLSDYSILIKNMPWTFEVRSEALPPLSGERKHWRIHYKTQRTVENTSKGGIYLKPWLTVMQFYSAQAADTAYEEKLAAAHPDMGLSYEWDHVILNNDSLYHLHASCVLSERNFLKMRQQLEEKVGIDKESQFFYCRCGSFCRSFTPTASAQD